MSKSRFIRRVLMVGALCASTVAVNSISESSPVSAAISLGTPNSPQLISAGDGFMCLSYSGLSGAVGCSGLNDQGQLGDGTTTNRNYLKPVSNSATISNPRQLSVGKAHACAVSGFGANPTAGKLYCWGDNQYGQLGDGTTTDRNVPTLVSDSGSFMNSDIQGIVVGDNHTCAITIVSATARLFCWGLNNKGQLGDGTNSNRNVATAVATPFNTGAVTFSSVNHVPQLAAGAEHTCAVANSTSRIWCWGENGSGQLGNGSTTDSSSPVDTTTTLSPVSNTYHGALVANADGTCSLGTGTLKCWGDNSVGQMGNGGGANITSPTAIPGSAFSNADLQYIDGGGQSFCAVTSVSPFTNYKLWCWGANNGGQLGDGTTTNRAVPTLVADSPGGSFTNGDLDKSGGNRNSKGIALSRSVTDGFGCVTYWCWGKNTYGQLAQGNSTDQPLAKIVQVGTIVEDDATGVTVTATQTSAGVVVNFSGLPSNTVTEIRVTIAPTSTSLFGAPSKYSAKRFMGGTLPSISNNAFSVTLASMSTSVISGGMPVNGTEAFESTGTYHLTYRVTAPATAGYPDGWRVVSSSELAISNSNSASTDTATAPAATTAPSATPTTTVPKNVYANAIPGVTVTDTKVYTAAPAKVAAASAIDVLTPAQAKTSDIVSKTPSVCLPNDEDLVFIDEGRCIAQVVNEKTRKVLRTLRTTVVADEVSELKVGNEIAVLSPLYFTAGTATMKASSVRRLNSLTTQVKAAGSILVAGHSGVLMGDTPENRALSRQRAATVVSALKKRGATADFAIAAVGALDPVSTGNSRADQDKNRRAVIVLIP